MASKLNPGADATLVNVAYRAAMANTPADYSDTFERMADSYEKTMEASSDMWGNIAKVGASIGGEMMKNAQELTDMVAKGATLNPEDAEMFTNEIYGVKDDLSSLGMFGGQFGDRETRLKRAELKAKQQELFADIDNAVANLKVGADAVAAGTLDDNLLGLKDKETINAIIKSNLKNKVTGEGNMAKLSRNEKGELVYTLYRENGELSDNPDGSGEPVTMTLKQFNEIIATNVKDGGAMMTAFGSLTEQEANAGNKALNGTYDPERQQMTLNKLDTLLGDKPVNLKRAMRTPVGYSNTSFYDDLTSKSVLSAELYGMLNNISGNEKGELTGGVVDGIEDVDGSGGISAGEINYDVLVGNITGLKDAEASKEFFKQYAVKEMEAAYKYGYSKKPPVPGSGTGADGNETDNLGIPDYTYPKFGSGKIDSYDARTLKRRLLNGTSFNFNPTGDTNDSRAYDFIGGTWYENYDDEEKRVEIGTADQLVLDVFQTNHEAFQGLSTSVPDETINIEGETTDVTAQKELHANIFNMIDLNKDNTVSTSLNNYFGLSGKRKTLQFRPYTKLAADDALKRSMGADSPWTNDIMLYNPQTGERVVDANGDIIRFKIGDSISNLDDATGLSKDVARILEVLKQNGVQPPTQLP